MRPDDQHFPNPETDEDDLLKKQRYLLFHPEAPKPMEMRPRRRRLRKGRRKPGISFWPPRLGRR